MDNYECKYLWRSPHSDHKNLFSYRIIIEQKDENLLQYRNLVDNSNNWRNWEEIEFITFGDPIYDT